MRFQLTKRHRREYNKGREDDEVGEPGRCFLTSFFVWLPQEAGRTDHFYRI